VYPDRGINLSVLLCQLNCHLTRLEVDPGIKNAFYASLTCPIDHLVAVLIEIVKIQVTMGID
jgi:hypothetical protein